MQQAIRSYKMAAHRLDVINTNTGRKERKDETFLNKASWAPYRNALRAVAA